MIDTHVRKYVQPVFDRVGKKLIAIGLTPIRITIIAFIMGMTSCIILYLGYPIVAVSFLWISGLFDVLDGSVARLTGKSSELGAFMDITFDRMIEIGLVISLSFLDPNASQMLVILMGTILLSISIFLTVGGFAKNTGKKSFYYQEGMMERTEGFLFFTLMMLFSNYRIWIGYLFAILILFTAGQRYVQAIHMLKEQQKK
jgi:phosphatidylglycerophosphate synthase